MGNNWHKPAPAFLVELVSKEPPLGPNPPTIIDWHETDERFIVVLEDGRKLLYRKIDEHTRRQDFTAADFKEHAGREKPSKKKD